MKTFQKIFKSIFMLVVLSVSVFLIGAFIFLSALVFQKVSRKHQVMEFRSFSYNADQNTFLRNQRYVSVNEQEIVGFDLRKDKQSFGWVYIESQVGSAQKMAQEHSEYQPLKIGKRDGYKANIVEAGEGRDYDLEVFIFQEGDRRYTITYYDSDQVLFSGYSLRDVVENVSTKVLAKMATSETEKMEHFDFFDVSFDLMKPFYIESFDQSPIVTSSYDISGKDGFTQIGTLTLTVGKDLRFLPDLSSWEKSDLHGYKLYKNTQNEDVYIVSDTGYVKISTYEPQRYAIENTLMYKVLLETIKF